MATDTRPSPLARVRPRRETLLWGALLVNTEFILLAGYALLVDAEVNALSGLRLWLYPFVWINVGIWALVRTDPADAPTRTRRLAALLAVGYFAVLAYAGGLVGHSHGVASGFRVALTSVPPGWSPAVTYAGSAVTLTVVPYRLFGYLVLAYLVYATVLDAASSAVTGVLGVLSCVSCSWPVIASVATGVAGSGSGVAAAVSAGSYGISTVVFVATAALLVWRPFGE